MKTSPIRLASTNKPGGADQHELADFLRMTSGNLGGDPTADASADEIELRKLESIENFEIVKHDVFYYFDIFVFVTLRTAGMGGCDHARACRQVVRETATSVPYRMNIGESMQIEQRRAAAIFEQPNFPAVDLNNASAQ